MAGVTVYSTNYCGYCVRAKMLLKKLGVKFEEVDVTNDPDKRDWLVKTTGKRTVPQIFINEQAIGGFDELAALERQGKLTAMIAEIA
ncbi:MAG: glutaredoxin 3 [Polyangiaceae bacterium]